MSWIALVEDSKFLRELYPSDPPGDIVLIQEFILLSNGPSIRLRLDFLSWPDVVPDKWRGKNVVQVGLCFVETSQLVATGWSTENIVSLTLVRSSPDGIRCAISGRTFEASFVARAAWVEGVTAYVREPAVAR